MLRSFNHLNLTVFVWGFSRKLLFSPFHSRSRPHTIRIEVVHLSFAHLAGFRLYLEWLSLAAELHSLLRRLLVLKEAEVLLLQRGVLRWLLLLRLGNLDRFCLLIIIQREYNGSLRLLGGVLAHLPYLVDNWRLGHFNVGDDWLARGGDVGVVGCGGFWFLFEL